LTQVVAQEAVAPFVVGVWGQGDAIIPFADFDGRRWRSSWPAPVDGQPDSRPLQQIPSTWWGRSAFYPTWEILESTGRRRRVEITATGAAGLGSSCSINIALKTDVPSNTYMYGSVLAANRVGVIQPVQALTSASADWRAVSAVLPGTYRLHEAAAWKEVPPDFRPDLSAPLSGPRLTAAFTSTDDLGQYLYFESTRYFAERRDQQGSEHSFVTGWLWRRSPAAVFQTVTIQAGLNDDDGKGEASFYPLGVVRSGAKRYWLGTLHSYASGAAAVLAVTRSGVTQSLIVGYGGC
jgi:hypothetical protein